MVEKKKRKIDHKEFAHGIAKERWDKLRLPAKWKVNATAVTDWKRMGGYCFY